MQIARASLALLAGCAYHAGTFTDWGGAFPGERIAFPCVDLAVAGKTDPYATGPVVAYAFGNRCDHHVTLDFASVRAIGRDASGAEIALAAYDPRGELRPLPLDARWNAREEIEYRPARADVQIASICVDVGGVERTAAPAARWVCIGQAVAP